MTGPARPYDRPVPRLGRRPASRLRLARTVHLKFAAAPPHPLVADHLAMVPAWVLGANDQFGTCVTPDTPVLTADLRWVPAGELAEGDHLLGFDEHRKEPRGGRDYRRSVVESAERVRKPCYDLTFEDGTTVRCSADHRWLAASTVQGQLKTQQWITTADMKCGPSRQTRVIKPLDTWDADTSRDAGYLAAAFDGEGCLEQRRNGTYANRLCFVQSPNPMLAEVERCLKELRYRYNHDVTSNGTRMRVDGTPRHDKHRIAVSPRAEMLRLLGSTRPARLLAKFDPDRLGRIDGRAVRLVRKTRVGVHEVVKLETSARTYLAAGFASHNCGPTSVANHAVMTWKYLLNEDITVTDDAIFALYRASGNPGFDPATGAGDGGVDMTVMLSALLKNGLAVTHGDGSTEVIRPVCFAAHSADISTVRAVTAIMGGSPFGVDLDVAQQAQTGAHPPLWDYQAGSGEWGGHAIMAGSYTSSAAAHTADESVITWAEKCGTTDAFLAAQLAECYALIWQPLWDDDTFSAGIDKAALAADYEAVTGRKFPLPVPAPAPAPAPPAPPPAPVPPGGGGADAADTALWAEVHHWTTAGHMGANRHAAAAVRRWARAKGLLPHS